MPTERWGGTTWTVVDQGEMVPSMRLNPPFYEDEFMEVERELTRLEARPLGRFIPDELPDGSKGITYGQVGARVLSPRGSVRYLQVINIRETGIDFAIKPDRVAENSHNDPPRSRVRPQDILLTNTAFRGTQTLMGRCVVVHRDFGKLNISQDIDRIRVVGINPYFVCVFLKSSFGKLQIERVVHGVDSTKINFGRIRSLLIPDVPESVQRHIEWEYLDMANCHDRAMQIKERILAEQAVDPGRFGETINALAENDREYKRNLAEAKNRLRHLIQQVEKIIEGSKRPIKPFRVPRIAVP